jgi:hypothetical protein
MTSSTTHDLYSVLGVNEHASQEDLKTRYRKLARLLHPDASNDDASAERFKLVTHAYSVLSDPVRRREYDQKRARESESTQPTAGPATPPPPTRYLPFEPARVKPSRIVSAPFRLQRGWRVHPQDPDVRLHRGRLGNQEFCGRRISFEAQAYSVLIGIFDRNKLLSTQTVGYEAWVPGSMLVGREGFEFWLGRPARGPEPDLLLRWVATPVVAGARPADPDDPKQVGAVPPVRTSTCAECRFHRVAESMVPRVFQELSPFAGDRVAELRLRMEQEESDHQPFDEDHFQGLRRKLGIEAEDLPWPSRPTDPTMDYCGVREQDRVWLFIEAKNQTGTECSEGLKRDGVRRSCGTCAHTRPSADALLLAVQHCIGSIGYEATHLLGQMRAGLEARAELEVSAVMSTRGVSQQLPILLPHCARYSNGHAYAVTACLNPGDSCQSWEPAGKRPTLMPEVHVLALRTWAAVEELRRKLEESQERDVDRPLATNIWSVSPADLLSHFNLSKEYDAARVAFLKQSLVALGFSAGAALGLATAAQDILHQQSRIQHPLV